MNKIKPIKIDGNFAMVSATVETENNAILHPAKKEIVICGLVKGDYIAIVTKSNTLAIARDDFDSILITFGKNIQGVVVKIVNEKETPLENKMTIKRIRQGVMINRAQIKVK